MAAPTGSADTAFTVRAAAADNWRDIEQIMGSNGGSVGCWCMFWRLTNAATAGRTADDNRLALRAVACEGEHAGLVLYDDGVPVGWCSVAPRPDYERVFHTNGIKPVDKAEIDEVDIWALVCVLVAKGHRGKGLSDRLVAAAVDFARDHGASIVEAYPIADSSAGRKSGLSSGTVGLFERAGFAVHTRPGKEAPGRRIVMRRSL